MKNIKELRNFLGDVMKDLKEGKIDVDKAKTISGLGQVIVDSAKVEVEFIKAAKIKDATDFISDGIVKQLHNGEPPCIITRPKAEYDNTTHDKRLKKYSE